MNTYIREALFLHERKERHLSPRGKQKKGIALGPDLRVLGQALKKEGGDAGVYLRSYE